MFPFRTPIRDLKLVWSKPIYGDNFTMQAQMEAPPEMQCKDKFLLQSVIAPAGATTKEITPEMFSKEAGHVIEEGSSPRAPHMDNGNSNSFEGY
ncbi:vesicle-associated protein 1-1-like [Apium graveolens]|uniref:vesicle-associated protein 1-1-like n=1 Tax=Apium graveolens TaxID=4045 RepID=UPI003D7BEE9C